MIELGQEHLETWARDRIVVLRGALDAYETRDLRRWTSELEAWPETPGRWMKYFEGEARTLCRVEDFLPWHDGLRGLLLRDDLMACLERLFGEPAVLFKEKINFKAPGGDGFAPHQDAPAFASFGQDWHVTAMFAIDEATRSNGCLEFVRGHAERMAIAQEEDGTVARDVEAGLCWEPLEAEPGDVVLFDSYVPHRSGRNESGTPRRAAFVTYNPASQGERRADYFARKRRAFPPECERDPNAPPDPDAATFNLGNPIR